MEQADHTQDDKCVCEGCRYVFNLVKESLDLDDAEALYKARNNATKCINQSLVVAGEQIGLPFSLSMLSLIHI